MKTKHTQGEWFITNNNTVCTKDVETIAIVHGPVGRYIDVAPEHHANAKLIAAAPDLLEALQELPDINADTSEWIDWIIKKDKAIKKATE